MFKLYNVTLIVFAFCIDSTKMESFVQKSNSERYNILMLLTVTAESHRNVFWPIAEALANKGHQVTILSHLPSRGNHENITEVRHDVLSRGLSKLNVFEIIDFVAFYEVFLPDIANRLYNSPEVMELYSRRKNFDLIMIDAVINEPAYPFLEGMRYVTVSAAGIELRSSAWLGNVVNPSYVLIEKPSNFWKRLQSLYFHLYYAIRWHYGVNRKVEAELKKVFPNFTSIEEVEKGVVLSLNNAHFSIDIALPLLPSQVEVGGMHCREAAKLPKDLQKFLDDAGPNGAIYFSLGSVARGSSMKQEHLKIFVETFQKLKMRVLWKMDQQVEGLSDNVMLKKWLPQQDVLGHKNVKLFITHGGLLSFQEALFHKVPLIVLPIAFDQPFNGFKTKNANFGTYIFWKDLNSNLLLQTIDEILSNKKYQKSINEASKAFRDQPMHPTDRAVWWIEYVIRSKGAPLLKSTAAELSWIEYLMLDVVLFLTVIMFLVLIVLEKIIRKTATIMFTSKTKKE